MERFIIFVLVIIIKLEIIILRVINLHDMGSIIDSNDIVYIEGFIISREIVAININDDVIDHQDILLRFVGINIIGSNNFSIY